MFHLKRLHFALTLRNGTGRCKRFKSFKNEGTLYLACKDKKAFFTSTDHRGYKLWSCQTVGDALSYLLDNILNDTSNVTDRVFAIFSKLCKSFKPNFQGSAKNI